MRTLCVWVGLLLGLSAPAVAAPPTLDQLQHQAEEVLDAIGATPEQRTALERIALESVAELDGVRGEVTTLGRDVLRILSAEDIDRARLELSRRDAVELLDRTSAELVPRAADAAEILSPEQRARVRRMVEEEGVRWLEQWIGA